jgi:hypothetical protein
MHLPQTYGEKLSLQKIKPVVVSMGNYAALVATSLVMHIKYLVKKNTITAHLAFEYYPTLANLPIGLGSCRTSHSMKCKAVIVRLFLWMQNIKSDS